MKAVVAAFNQEKALVGAFSVITNLWMELFEALDQWDWDSDLAAHSTAADTEHSPGHWRTLAPLHKWDTLLPQQNNMKLYGSTRVQGVLA